MSESDLERLDALRQQGVLSEEAYWEARARLYTPPPPTMPYDQPTTAYVASGVPLAPTQTGMPDPTAPPSPSGRTRRGKVILIAIAAIVICLGAGGVAAWWLTRSHTDQDYVAALRKANLLAQYPTQHAAITHAKAFCGELSAGHPAVGYRAERVAVQYYCRGFLPDFRVIPTPAEQLKAYRADLDANGLVGAFSSDAAAVAHARSICNHLKAGGAPQGKLVDELGVKTYCHEFYAGFKVLRTITVHGTFTLIDSDPSIYFPSISKLGSLCDGTGGYSDISFGTIVIVTNDEGKTLAHTTLGFGSGNIARCVFHFHFRVTAGERDYAIAVSHRGTVDYSFDDLLAGDVALTLGS